MYIWHNDTNFLWQNDQRKMQYFPHVFNQSDKCSKHFSFHFQSVASQYEWKIEWWFHKMSHIHSLHLCELYSCISFIPMKFVQKWRKIILIIEWWLNDLVLCYICTTVNHSAFSIEWTHSFGWQNSEINYFKNVIDRLYILFIYLYIALCMW